MYIGYVVVVVVGRYIYTRNRSSNPETGSK